MGSCSGTGCGWNTSFIPFMTAFVTCASCCCDVANASGMKSSPCTSTKYRKGLFGAVGGMCAISSPSIACCRNLWSRDTSIGCSAYQVVTSRAVSDATQKYAGDSTYPICREFGTTNLTDAPGGCGSTYAKFHSLHVAQSKCQKPSFISNLAIKMAASGSVSANA